MILYKQCFSTQKLQCKKKQVCLHKIPFSNTFWNSILLILPYFILQRHLSETKQLQLQATYNENRIKYTILLLQMIKSVILGLTNRKWLETCEQIKCIFIKNLLTMDVPRYCYSRNVPCALIWMSTVFSNSCPF